MKLKKYVLFLSIFALLQVFVQDAHSQLTKVFSTAKDSLLNQDTTYIKLDQVESDARSIHLVVNRKSGTAAGRAVLKASNNGTDFEVFGADTLTLSNKAVNNKFWKIAPVDYSQYYIEIISSNGTAVLKAKAYLSRRKQ